MTLPLDLTPLSQIESNQEHILAIKRNDLLPLLNDPHRLSHYADHLVQAQGVLLNGVDPKLNQQLSEVITQIIQQLSLSKKFLGTRRFNALQKWLGIDIEYDAGQVKYLKDLDHLINEANHLSQRLQIEIQKSQSRLQQALGLREQMAAYIQAADQFLMEYPQFSKQQVLDHFVERLSKKINTLQTLQSSNDIAIKQMQLSQHLSFSLLDRFKEAQQVLIPAWQYHLKQSRESKSSATIEQLDKSREDLIQNLKKSLQK
ncbi:tellurium resistance protein [Acinetobacter sp. C26M]|uniref:tellurium resistance protein n=1 Tax=unclassified Acinetobacter TaxID=196816 RepID=UPI001423DF72|nr:MULTISPECIES: tellurium resistance protein [unclassified Acinetobacter]NIE97160.1 tellurium resistance protein [Acinetobacter sp. Tr-809]USA45240.1 tellurium resistance protein [Acinetobacter sp. C26M]USA48742.1 tellurium resistance protein [Acinetobacter sp. C26G]